MTWHKNNRIKNKKRDRKGAVENDWNFRIRSRTKSTGCFFRQGEPELGSISKKMFLPNLAITPEYRLHLRLFSVILPFSCGKFRLNGCFFFIFW
jgi:hypothetical protein